jgi:hypothetical protein
MTDEHILDKLGGNKAIAEALSLAPNVVANWRKRGIPWPRRHIIARIAEEKKVALPEDFWAEAAA